MGRLINNLNCNNVKVETGKTTTYLEREPSPRQRPPIPRFLGKTPLAPRSAACMHACAGRSSPRDLRRWQPLPSLVRVRTATIPRHPTPSHARCPPTSAALPRLLSLCCPAPCRRFPGETMAKATAVTLAALQKNNIA